MCLSRSDFSHYETSGSGIKLTKISCDIAATAGADPLNPAAPRCFSLVAPSGHLTRSSTAESQAVHRADISSAFHTLPCCDLDSSRPWQKLVARPLMTSVIVSCSDGVRSFLSTDIRPCARAHHSPTRLSEYHCLGGRFGPVRRSAKAFPFGLPSTRFWPNLINPL